MVSLNRTPIVLWSEKTDGCGPLWPLGSVTNTASLGPYGGLELVDPGPP